MSFQNAPIIPARRRYKRLFQDLDECIVHSTEEDDEDVLYERRDLKGSIGRSDSHELVTYSLSDLDLPKPSPAWKETALAGCSRLRCLTIALLMFFTVVILFVTVAGIYLLVTSPGLVTIGSPQNESHLESDEIPLGTQPAPSPQTVPPSTVAVPAIVNYTLAFPNTMTQTTPEFFDLNEDEILDVVVAVTATESDNLNVWACSNKEEMKKFEEDCSRNKGYYSCGTLAVALNGQDGSVLWEYKTPLPIFAITCTHDLNGNGKPDCMLCGRSGFWHAVDGKTGEFIWDVDHSIVMIYHNFYFPLAVGDLDDDGTVDFVNVHGGDPRDKADNHNRPPARFVVVSGRTGQKLLDPLLVPDMKESYMNPIQYRTGDEDFILFGSGGETIEGGLWALTIESLRDKIESYALNHNNGTYSNDISNNPHCREYYTDYVFQPLLKADPIQYTISDVLDQSTLDEYHKACPKTIFHPIPNVHNLCIYRVVFSPEKGVILPPVIIDMDNDGIEDLVISLYSGHTTVMNGQSGDVIWDRYVPGTESYSTPAPLYYSEDNIPDLLIRVNKGEWDTHYNYSYVGIVDGTNGELLWALNSSEAGFMSGTTLRGEGYGKDALLFLTVGMLPTEPLDKVKSKEIVTIGNMTPHHYRSKRAVNPKDRKLFSPTEELDRLLGHRIERGGSVLGDLADLLNGNDSREDTSNANSTAGSASQTITSSFDPQILATTVVYSTSTSVVTAASSSSPPSISNATNTSENVQGTVAWAPSVAVSPSEGEGLSMSTLALPLEEVSEVDEVSTVSTSESLVTGSTSSVQAPVLPDKSRNLSLVVDSSAEQSTSSGGFSSSDVPKPHSTTKVPISSPSQEMNFDSSSTSTGIIVNELSATTQSSSSLSSSSPSSIAMSSSILLAGKSSSSTTVPQGTTSLKTSVQSSQPSTPSPSSISSTSHSSILISSLSMSSSEISGTSVSPSATTSPPASPSYMSDKILEGIDKGRRYFEQLRKNNLLKFWENWREIYHHNPKNETKEFMKEDCNSHKNSDYIYFLTADMIRNNSIYPISTEEPRLTFPDVDELNAFFEVDPRRRRRHGHNDEDSDDHKSLSLQELRAQWGCHHVIHPSMVVSTPSFVDVNGDGHVEVVYLEYMSGTGTSAFSMVPNKLSTAKVYLKVVTLEEAFNQQLGDKAAVNFNMFLPFDKQPWTKYMGSNGDNVYRENV